MLRSLSIITVVTFAAWGPSVLAQSKLPSVDEAVKISKQTGKPVFAMAGQET